MLLFTLVKNLSVWQLKKLLSHSSHPTLVVMLSILGCWRKRANDKDLCSSPSRLQSEYNTVKAFYFRQAVEASYNSPVNFVHTSSAGRSGARL